VSRVVDDLRTVSDLDTQDLMIVGACCRDILHASYGHTFPLRASHDVDVAIAMSDWTPFEQLACRLPPSGDTGIRYLVNDVLVDLLPFGEVEDPAGIVTPATRSDSMDVFAFQEVFDVASVLPLPSGEQIKIPTIAGFCALKTSAWANRSEVHEYRDGPDIAVATFWYSEEQSVLDRIFDTDEGNQVYLNADMNVRRAAATLLGRDVAAEIGPGPARALSDRWPSHVRRRLDHEYGHEAIPNWPTDLAQRAEIIDALATGLRGADAGAGGI
jgi:predicted nucleotidyltransferase